MEEYHTLMYLNKKDLSLMNKGSNMSSFDCDAHFKGYKLYNLSNDKVVISCDVEFHEEAICSL